MGIQPGWTFAAAAIELGVTRGRVSQLVKAGKLRTVTVHGRAYITPAAVRDYLAEMRDRSAGKERIRHVGA